MGFLGSRWLALRNSLWLLPSAVVAVCAGLAVVLIRVDEHARLGDTAWAFGGDASAARSVLSTIAASLITVTGLVLSITIIVLQLASSQFSPRVLRNLLADRVTQVTVGGSLGVFVFALIALRSVRTADGSFPGFVPALCVTVAIVLALAALIMLIAFIHHISQLIQVSSVTARIARETLGGIDRLYPDPYGTVTGPRLERLAAEWQKRGTPTLVLSNRPGFVQAVHLERISEAVEGVPVCLSVDVAPGDFVGADGVLARVWGPRLADGLEDAVRRGITVADERDHEQDVAFGVRQLTDVALRALSSSLNDPTTAVTCIGYLGSVMARLAGRSLLPRIERHGESVIVARERAFGEYLETFAEVGAHAGDDARVLRALREALTTVEDAAETVSSADRVRQVRELAA